MTPAKLDCVARESASLSNTIEATWASAAGPTWHLEKENASGPGGPLAR